MRAFLRSCGAIIVALAWLGAASAGAAPAACGAPNAGGIALCTIDQSFYPGTLCNDGTQPVMWLRPGSGSGTSTWLIWLEGGGDCVDAPSCAARAQSQGSKNNRLLTSTGYKPPLAGGGILASDAATNRLLYNANVVEVHYCSSDDWSGGYVSGVAFNASDPGTWDFGGRAIAMAAVATLRQLPVGFQQANAVFLGGDSAGGEGVSITVNDLLPLLNGVPTVGLINDAGFALNIGQYSSQVATPHATLARPDAFDLKVAAGMALWHGRGDAHCSASATTLQARIDCYNSARLLHLGDITVPSFVAESQIDTAQLTQELCPATGGKDCGIPTCSGTARGAYAVAFGKSMAAELATPKTVNAYSVFSPNAYMHVMLADPLQYRTAFTFPGGVVLTPAEALNAWLANLQGRAIHRGKNPGVPPCSQVREQTGSRRIASDR